MRLLLELFLGMGLMGALLALVINVLLNSVAMWFVINHMMDLPGGAPFHKCVLVTVLLPIVLVIGILVWIFLPIRILNTALMWAIIGGGSRGVVEGIFEMTEGYTTVIIFYWMATFAISYGVNKIMPDTGRPDTSGYFEVTSEYDDDEFGGYTGEMNEAFAELEQQIEMQQRINAERTKVTLVELDDDAVRVMDVFRSEKLEQVDLPRLRKESGFGMEDYIVLGVFINTVKELSVVDVDEGKITFAYPTTSSITFDPLDEWPAPGNFYRGIQAYKIFRANEDGSLYEGDDEESTTEDSSSGAEESNDILAAVSEGDEIVDYYYYIFFNMKNPDDLSDCHLVFEPVSRTFEIRSMGDVLAEMSN